MEFSRQNTGVGSHSLVQGIFPTQGSNQGLLNCRQILYCLSHKGPDLIPGQGTKALQTVQRCQKKKKVLEVMAVEKNRGFKIKSWD